MRKFITMTEYTEDTVPIAHRRHYRGKHDLSNSYNDIICGVYDIIVDNMRITRHALDRCKERKIPLEDLHRLNPKFGTPVMKGNTIVTMLPKKSKKKYHKSKKSKMPRKKCNQIIVDN